MIYFYRTEKTVILALFLIAALIGSAFAESDFTNISLPRDQQIALASESDQVANLTFNLENLEHSTVWVDDQQYDQFQIEGEFSPSRVGYPELPTVTRFMLIPPRSGVSLNVEDIEYHFEEGMRPYPAQPVDDSEVSAAQLADPEARNGREFVSLTPEINQVVSVDGFYPADVARVGRPAIIRGYRIVPIIINPVRYNPATGDVQIVESLSFNLDYTSDENTVNLVENPDRPRPSRYFHKIVSDLVLNPPPERDVPPTGGSILYVMGNWDAIDDELAPLVEWRRRMGWTVEVVHVNSQDGQANKNAIMEAYESDNPPEYVVIVGDTDGQYPRAYWDMRRGGNWPYESDNPYVELEGDDPLPEAAIGRLVFNSPNMLAGLVAKTIAYESDPYIGQGDEIGWQKRAAVVAGDSRSGVSSIDVCRWTKDLVLRHGFNSVEELYWTPQDIQPNAAAFINSNFNDGISLFMYRGWTYMSGFGFDAVDQLRNRRMLPFVMLATCNTGDYGEHVSSTFYYTERFSYSANGGGIGAVGAAGATHTAYNNLIASTTFKSYFADGIYTQGAAFMNSKFALYSQYFDRGDINHQENPGLEAWLCELYIFNLMGDPAVDLFTDIPLALEIEEPGAINIGQTDFSVVVRSEEDDTPVADALVCLYKTGEFQLVARTDENGRVDFAMNPEWTQDGTINLTVTGHNLHSMLIDYEVGQAENFLGAGSIEIDDDEQGESNGDGDGIANPTETLEITVPVVNYGANTPDGEIQLLLEPISAHVEVVDGEASLNNAPESGEAENAAFVVTIGGGFAHGQTALFNLTATAGENSWTSIVSIPIESSDLEIESIEWPDGVPGGGDLKDLRITLKNVGSRPSPAMTATLTPLVRTLGAPQADGSFPVIDPDEVAQAEEVFRISANAMHLSGVLGEAVVVLEADNGLVDSAYFSFNVAMGGEDQPFGPDTYGYLCFDDTDEAWFMAPIFNWVEINPDIEGHVAEGVNTELRDSGEEDDESLLIDLPFTFTYYGEDFTNATICTNGWMALGDHHELTTARNRRIPAGMVGSSMLCPFWEDLLTTNDGGIFTWFDEENHRFIVEWSNMRKLGPRAANEPTETFQIILHDPEFYPSFTGDGDIIFQYNEVTDDQSCYQEWDTPFATVGIGSPDQTTGLEYTFGGETHPSAAPLEQGRAILFSTLVDFQMGALEGDVIDVLTNEPVPGVTISTTYGFTAMTDENGHYVIEDVLVDTSITYEVTAHKTFYNDSTVAGIEIIPEETAIANFGLLRPVFSLDIENVDISIEQENANDFYIPFRNEGSGHLEYSSKLEFRDVGAPRDDPFDRFLSVDISNAFVGIGEENDTLVVGNKKINGVCFVDSLFYVCAGGSERNDIWPQIYRFTRNGEFVDSLQQPWLDNNGVRGLAYDGTNLWGAFEHQLRKLDKNDITELDSFEVPQSRPLDVAYDPLTGTLYTLDTTQPIVAYDTLGNALTDSLGEELTWDPEWDGTRLRKYGLAWYSGQPEGYHLLVFCYLDDHSILFGLNPETGEVIQMADLGELDGDTPRGIDVMDRWNTSVWTLCVSFNNPDADRMSIYELEPNSSWFAYNPAEGVLEAGEEVTLHLSLNAGLKDHDRYWLNLVYHHNADPGIYEIPIVMNVVEESGLKHIELTPMQFGLECNYPNPFNPSTTLAYNLPSSGVVKLAVFDINGRLIDTLVNGYKSTGRHIVTFDGSDLPAGVYMTRLTAEGRSSTRKIVLMK